MLRYVRAAAAAVYKAEAAVLTLQLSNKRSKKNNSSASDLSTPSKHDPRDTVAWSCLLHKDSNTFKRCRLEQLAPNGSNQDPNVSHVPKEEDERDLQPDEDHPSV